MAHFFHAMLAVEFPQDVPISQARKDADKQLAKRIKDPMLRAWLLMNVMQDEHTQEIRWKINVNAIYEAFKKHIGTMERTPTVGQDFYRNVYFSQVSKLPW